MQDCKKQPMGRPCLAAGEFLCDQGPKFLEGWRQIAPSSPPKILALVADLKRAARLRRYACRTAVAASVKVAPAPRAPRELSRGDDCAAKNSRSLDASDSAHWLQNAKAPHLGQRHLCVPALALPLPFILAPQEPHFGLFTPRSRL